MGTATSALMLAARRYADEDGISAGNSDDTAVKAFLNDAYAELWDEVILATGDHFLTSQDFTISTAGTTYAFSTDSLNVYQVRGIDRNPSDDHPETVLPFEFSERNVQQCRMFLVQGAAIRIEPKSLSVGDYRLWYMDGPATLDDGPPDVQVDDRVDRWHDFIEMRAGQKILEKQESDASHLARILAQYVDRRIKPLARRMQGAGPQKASRIRTSRDRLRDPLLFG